ncbi:alpha/beta fold hydrolase [Bradyrhizobium sp. RDT10]
MNRREILGLAGAATAAVSLGVGSASGQGNRNTFVLVHGAWHGGWCWRNVADKLRAAGHSVFTPTCTGLGERSHLLSAHITLDTFTIDVANVLEAEELKDVVLVGHSFAGSAISGVAEKMPNRIKHLVYLDALIVEPGKAPFDNLPSNIVAARIKAAQETSGGLTLPSPAPSVFGVPDGPDSDWVKRRLTPHPISTYESKLNIKGPIGNNLPRTYIHCANPSYGALQSSRDWVKSQQGWRWREIAAGHDAMVTAPDELARMLAEISQA